MTGIRLNTKIVHEWKKIFTEFGKNSNDATEKYDIDIQDQLIASIHHWMKEDIASLKEMIEDDTHENTKA